MPYGPAIKRAEKYAARMAKNVSKTTKEGIKALVVRSIREGVSPYDTARLIRSIAGLDSRSVAAVMNYRASMMNTGRPATQVDAAVEKYAAKKLRERATRIARTEIMQALNGGQLDTLRQRIADGEVSRDQFKVWINTEDKRQCDDCRSMHGRKVRVNESFATSAGIVDAPPIHPMCRCTFSVQ